MEKMFEKATRLKLRLDSRLGLINVEDLWDLKLNALDAIAINLNRQIKEHEQESFISPKTKVSEETELAFEITKHVIKTKLEEKEVSENAAAKRATRQKLIDALAKAEEKALGEKSIEELKKELEALD